tara:strand:- start:9238 stop:9873 length:636 start_codon:yes stop_codon:yes gene_type:complete
MALFGSARDISMFRHVNRELLNEIIDTRCDIFKNSIFDSKENLYGEALRKVYMPGVRLAGLVDKEGKEYTSDDIGVDWTRAAKFSFLRDDILALENSGTTNTIQPNSNAQEASVFLEVGDVIYWDGQYFEIDDVAQGQYLFGKNPESSLPQNASGAQAEGSETGFGASWSVICQTHVMRKSKINTLEDVRSGYDEYVSDVKEQEQGGGLYG